jgi:hypothetical protein
MAHSFTWNGARRMKSSECAARTCNRGIGLFSHFAPCLAQNIFEWCMLLHSIHSFGSLRPCPLNEELFKSNTHTQSKRRSPAIVRHHAITASLLTSKKERSLHVIIARHTQCTFSRHQRSVRLADMIM